jgi:hypothetical protein
MTALSGMILGTRSRAEMREYVLADKAQAMHIAQILGVPEMITSLFGCDEKRVSASTRAIAIHIMVRASSVDTSVRPAITDSSGSHYPICS